jgi:hypothetical protein
MIAYYCLETTVREHTKKLLSPEYKEELKRAMLDALLIKVRADMERQAAAKLQITSNLLGVLSEACKAQAASCSTSTSASSSFGQDLADVLLLMRFRLPQSRDAKQPPIDECDINDTKRRIITRALIFENDACSTGATPSSSHSHAGSSPTATTATSGTSTSNTATNHHPTPSSTSTCTTARSQEARPFSPSSTSTGYSFSSSWSSFSSLSISPGSPTSSSLGVPYHYGSPSSTVAPLSPDCVTVLDWQSFDSDSFVHPWHATISAFEVVVSPSPRHTRRYLVDVFPVFGKEQLAYFSRVSEL